MYTVSKGPSKILNRTRHGISQKLDSVETVRELTRKSSADSSPPSSPELSPPRPVFTQRIARNPAAHPSTVGCSAAVANGVAHSRRHHRAGASVTASISCNSSCRRARAVAVVGGQDNDVIASAGTGTAGAISPQHAQLIMFLSRSWQSLQERHDNSPDSPDCRWSHCEESRTHPALEDFQPFNLDAWMSLRLYQQVTGATL